MDSADNRSSSEAQCSALTYLDFVRDDVKSNSNKLKGHELMLLLASKMVLY